MLHLENMEMHWYIIYHIILPKNHISITYVLVIRTLILLKQLMI